GPLTDRIGRVPVGGKPLPRPIADHAQRQDLALWSYASAAAQAAAIADDIAYDAHDIDDGLRADLFAVEELATLPLVGVTLTEIAAVAPDLEPTRRVHELIR